RKVEHSNRLVGELLAQRDLEAAVGFAGCRDQERVAYTPDSHRERSFCGAAESVPDCEHSLESLELVALLAALDSRDDRLAWRKRLVSQLDADSFRLQHRGNISLRGRPPQPERRARLLDPAIGEALSRRQHATQRVERLVRELATVQLS